MAAGARLLLIVATTALALLSAASHAVAQRVLVTPQNAGSAPTRTANTGGHSETFTIKNTGSASNTFSFTCSGAGGVVCGPAPEPVTLAAGEETTLTQSYSVGAPGTGTLTLTARGTNASGSGSYSVPIVSRLSAASNAVAQSHDPCIICDPGDDNPPEYGVSVTPDDQSFGTVPTNSGGHTITFTVTNTGNAFAASYSLTCSGTNGITCTPNPGDVGLGPGHSTKVTVTFATGGTRGPGLITLTASSMHSTGHGYSGGTLEHFGVFVTAQNGGSGPTREANTGGHSETFTIKNTGSTSNTFTFACHGTGGVTCGSAPAAVTLAAGEETTVTQSYSVGAPDTGALILTAYGTYASYLGVYWIPIVSYGVSVTPRSGTAPTRTANTGGHSGMFTIKNTGSASNTFSFTCSGAGGVVCGPAPEPVMLGNDEETTLTQSYSVGAPGTGTLTLTATGTNASDLGNYTVPIISYGVVVAPKGDAAPRRTANTEEHSETFTIRNTGSTSNTFSFTCTGAGGVVCGPAPAPVTLRDTEETRLTQSFSVGAPGTGTLTLTATGMNASDPGSYTIPVVAPISDIFQSSVTNGAFTRHSSYVIQETANTYDYYGRIEDLTDARGKVTRYAYGGNSNDAFLTKVTRVKDGTGSVDLVTDFAYNSNGYLESIKDEGGSYRRFAYDSFGRLYQVRNHGNVLVEEYTYQYSRTSANGWAFVSANPNLVTTTTYLSSSKSVVTREYLDGLGRPIQSNVQDGTTYYVTAQQYDAMGRPWRTWKPYPRTSPAYDPSFSTNAKNWYNAYHSPETATAYRETQYTADALARVKKEIPEYVSSAGSATVQYAYGVDTGAKQTYTEITDEAGKKKRSYTDLFGNEVKTILGYGASEASTTTLAYNVLGQRTRVTDPRNLVTTYALDARGQLTGKTSPDAGTVSHKYDSGGNLRYTQDANQAAAGHVHFTMYDFAGRPIRSGVGAATFSSLNPDATSPYTLETTQGNWRTVWAYDAKPPTGAGDYPWNIFGAQINGATLSNVSGRLAAVASQSNGAWQVTLYSYDTDGRVDKRYIYTQANGGGPVLAALNTTVSYTHDLRDAVTQRTLTVGSSSFYHWYDYDGRGLLSKVYASTSSTQPSSADVTYTYRPSGAVQERQYENGPAVPMRYTIREALEQIGDPAITAYPFSARYAYHNNGTVKESEFYSAGSPAAYKRYKYDFPSYDALNRLKSANFSLWAGGAWTGTLAHSLSGINYDKSGNLTALQRYQESGALIDNLTYTIHPTSNRLSQVADAISGNAETWDAKSGSFTYDANGNLKTSPAPYSITDASYDHWNLPLLLTRGGVDTKYRYDHAGQRITKQTGTAGNTEVYLLDGPSTLAVYTVNGTGSVVSSYFNVLSGDRVVGRQPSTGNRKYYHTDLLGSTRAVVEGTTVVESYDYDPWGLLLPGRTLGSGTKEGFTGKERDAETGLDYFGARHYMAALGRWTTVDPPADSFPSWSPYNYVQNNPITLRDPFGLCPIRGWQNLWGLLGLDASTGDCPRNDVGNALRTIDSYGGENGRMVLQTIADEKLNIRLASGYYLVKNCGKHPACTEGSLMTIRREAKGADLPVMIFHEGMHVALKYKNRSIEEGEIWNAQLDFYSNIPNASSPYLNLDYNLSRRTKIGRAAFFKEACQRASEEYKQPCP